MAGRCATPLRGVRLAALIAIVSAAACDARLPSPTGQPDDPQASPATSSASVPASPSLEPSFLTATRLDVTIRTDAGRTASDTIGPKGGSIKLALAKGTTATLRIEPYALLQPTTIKMTAASIEDWPDAPPDLSAVQLEPDGLELFVPATLSFEQTSIRTDGTHGEIGWSGQGRGLRPLLASRDGGRVSLSIEHFSGYGLVWNIGSEEYWTSWSKTLDVAAAANVESALAQLMGQWTQKELLGIEHEPLIDMIAGVIDTWYDHVYEPAMRDGETTCDGARTALAQLYTMIRLLETLGISGAEAYQAFLLRRKEGQSTQFPFDKVPEAYLDAVLQRCDAEALLRCRTTGDIELLLMYVRDRHRSVVLWGRDTEEDQGGADLILKCARYHLEAEFTFGHDYTETLPGESEPFRQLRLHWQLKLNVDLEWRHFEGTPPWFGVIDGEARPTLRMLEARVRYLGSVGGDRGTTYFWQPWCNLPFEFGPWHPWRVQLTSLQFHRSRLQRVTRLPYIPVPGIALLPPRTIVVEGPLQTDSFKDGEILFDELRFATDSGRCTRPGQNYTISYAVLGSFLRTQPKFTSWRGVAEGTVGMQKVGLRDAMASPFRAKREWNEARVDKYSQYFDIESSVKHEATIMLTHTPG